jgi:hypothetical protein
MSGWPVAVAGRTRILCSLTSRHGDRCGCRLLAEALGCDPRNLRVGYCRTVLMRHWIVECNHGSREAPVAAKKGGKWHDVGPIDPVKAILVAND